MKERLQAGPGGRVLVTGGGGLIGAEVVRRLRAEGLEPLAPSRAELDLARPGGLDGLKAEELRAVVHGAALIPGKDPALTEAAAAETNRFMDEQAINFCRERGLPLVYLSSLAVYGPPSGPPLTEEAPLRPAGPYAAAKIAGEELARNLSAFAALRVGAPYGPAMTAPTVVKIFMDRARAGQDLTYHGSGSREQIFIHAADVARAVLAALKNLAPEAFGGGRPWTDPRRVFNITGAEAVSMKALAELALRLTGSGGRVRASGQPDPQEDYRPRFSLAAAAEVLGWRPSISLEEGLRAWLTGEPPC